MSMSMWWKETENSPTRFNSLVILNVKVQVWLFSVAGPSVHPGWVGYTEKQLCGTIQARSIIQIIGWFIHKMTVYMRYWISHSIHMLSHQNITCSWNWNSDWSFVIKIILTLRNSSIFTHLSYEVSWKNLISDLKA